MPACGFSGNGPETAAAFPAVSLALPDGSRPARLAQRGELRAIGYRHISLSDAPPAIYFRYNRPRVVHFHMRDVAFPLRAFWLGQEGCVIDHVDMVPDTEGYRSPGPVAAVLEVPHHYLGDYPLTRGDCIHLQ